MRRFLSHGALYFGSSLAARGLTIVLTPLYTRLLAPEDFGRLGLANTVGALATLILGFALHGALSRFWFEANADHKKLVSTTVAFFAIVPTVITALALASGLDPFAQLPGSPHLQLVLIAAWLGIFQALPQTVFAAREQPGKVAAFNLALVAVQLAMILGFVVGLKQGLVGILKANAISQGVLALVALFMMREWLGKAFDAPLLRRMLLFSLPLLPHLLGSWLLSLSDRMVLERYVDPAQLGAYSLAYLFNSACLLLCSAIAQALTPLVTKELERDVHSAKVIDTGRVAWLTMIYGCTSATILAPEALRILAPKGPLTQALDYIPFVVIGAAFQGAYFILSQGTWFTKKMGSVAFVTTLAAGINLAANLIFVPRYGVLAAAVNTALGYGALCVMHGLVSHHFLPIRWQYGRWLLAAVCCLAAYFVCAALPNLAFKALIVFALLPGVLSLFGRYGNRASAS